MKDIQDPALQMAMVIGGLGAGALCGLAPLGVGIVRRQPALGVGSLLACMAAGLLRGFPLAAPIALIFVAALLCNSQEHRSDAAAMRRLPVFSAIMFTVGILLSFLSWIVLTGDTTDTYLFVFSTDDLPPGLQAKVRNLAVAAWLVTLLGIVGGFLLLLRFRFAVWLGWAFLACEFVSLCLSYILVTDNFVTKAEIFSQEFIVTNFAIRIVFWILYAFALRHYRRVNWPRRTAWLRRARSKPAQREEPVCPSWMKEVRFSSRE